MKRPTLRVLEYRHSKTHPWYLDLRPFNRGRKFFKTKAEAEAERLRQITTLERHGREAVGLAPGDLTNRQGAVGFIGWLGPCSEI